MRCDSRMKLEAFPQDVSITVSKVVSARSNLECATQCLAQGDCKAYAWQQSHLRCSLSNSATTTNGDVQSATGAGVKIYGQGILRQFTLSKDCYKRGYRNTK